jgi:hypothetical protein
LVKRCLDLTSRFVRNALPEFWRTLYALEKIGEAEFFDLANRAFPQLIFNPDLTFRRFDGGYQDLLPEVVRHLAVLNDHNRIHFGLEAADTAADRKVFIGIFADHLRNLALVRATGQAAQRAHPVRHGPRHQERAKVLT